MFKPRKQSGFTLMEVVVSTAIFATTVTMMMSLFNYTLKINRRVEGLRQAAQLTRGFTEPVIREIRNGRIDYTSNNPKCVPAFYRELDNTSLALVSPDGSSICYYLDSDAKALFVSKNTDSGFLTEKITPDNVEIDPDMFRFIVKPTSDPADTGNPPSFQMQPMVTLIGKFSVQIGSAEEPTVIPYQTTISSDIYSSTYVPHL